VANTIYYRARWYDPSMGRFITEDPIEFEGGSNWYAYVGNNPVNAIDPLGLEPGPTNNIKDPFASEHWILNGLTNTGSDLLGLDLIAESAWNVADYCRPTSERVIWGAIGITITALDVISAGSAGAMLNGAVSKAVTRVGLRRAVTKSTERTLARTGARELPFWDIKGADRAYEVIRQSSDDVAAISKNTGISESRIARIKDHIFNNKHQLDDGVRRFDADPDIANAWGRLKSGSHTEKDLQLLEHELFESKFEGIFKTNYRTAHDAANRSGRTSGLE
jgi:uncharacterized protein RhaS with RHS repeats